VLWAPRVLVIADIPQIELMRPRRGGHDGNLWFTEYDGSKIGRITPAGTITEFPLPIPPPYSSSRPQVTTAGPDGNLWFTESAGNKIGRISP
jgi:virginiamycin B lyase